MEQEYKKYSDKGSVISIESVIFRQGISRFNLENFGEAHISFSRALEMLYHKKRLIEKDIAKISAYEDRRRWHRNKVFIRSFLCTY